MKTMNITYRQPREQRAGRAEEVEGGEEGSDRAEARGTLKKNCHKDGMYVNIPMTESLWPRLEWAQIQP